MTLHELLLKKYPPAEYALMKEVSDAAGFSRSRSADYIAVNLWPSRGLSINGIEVKSYRSDWLNELKNPAKAENILQYCDYFWLLTDKEGIAKLEEIPTTWGWMEVKNNKIVTRKEAPKLSPNQITKHFMAAMLKRAACKDGYVLRDSIKAEIDAAVEKATVRDKQKYDNLQKDHVVLSKMILEFEQVSGIKISHPRWLYDPVETAKAVRFITDGGISSLISRLKQIESIVEDVGKTIERTLAACEEINNPVQNNTAS